MEKKYRSSILIRTSLHRVLAFAVGDFHEQFSIHQRLLFVHHTPYFMLSSQPGILAQWQIIPFHHLFKHLRICLFIFSLLALKFMLLLWIVIVELFLVFYVFFCGDLLVDHALLFVLALLVKHFKKLTVFLPQHLLLAFFVLNRLLIFGHALVDPVLLLLHHLLFLLETVVDQVPHRAHNLVNSLLPLGHLFVSLYHLRFLQVLIPLDFFSFQCHFLLVLDRSILSVDFVILDHLSCCDSLLLLLYLVVLRFLYDWLLEHINLAFLLRDYLFELTLPLNHSIF